MKWVGILLLLLWACFPVRAASPAEAWETARLQYVCAWMSLASYDDRLGELSREELSRDGWTVRRLVEKGQKAEAKFNLAEKELEGGGQILLLAVAGTSSAADVKTDLTFHTVPFHPEDEGDKNVPEVHRGFDNYTRTLLESPYEGETVASYLLQWLGENPRHTLLLTGHSLGGAVAVLLGARLADAGADPAQMEILTFGAPAVGNRFFNARYAPLLPVTQISIQGDPVRSVLQKISGSYAPFTEKTEWKENPNSRRFEHDIVVYIDAALRNYYDARRAYTEAGHRFLPSGEPPQVYALPMQIHLPASLDSDAWYMSEAADDILQRRTKGVVFGEANASWSEICRAARAAGCPYILVRELEGKRIPSEAYDFRMTYTESLCRTGGQVVSVQTRMTRTDQMTPIEAAAYLALTSFDDRKEIL